MASCSPAWCSRSFEILDVALLRLRFQSRCGLDLDFKLPFLDGHQVINQADFLFLCSRYRLRDNGVATEEIREKDLVRGLIRLHILYHASRKPIFGLWLIRRLRHLGYELSPGTLYPLLQRLEESGQLACKKTLVDGKIRKTYRATPAGEASLDWGKARMQELFGELFE